MLSDYKIKRIDASETEEVVRLLQESHLPTEDINFSRHFFLVAKDNNIVAGAIGLELLGDYGLLRSMITHAAYRNKGVASLLVKELLAYAKKEKLKEVYLLTETAEEFFTKKGFKKVSREDAPVVIKQSKEFTHLCPSSATVMKKDVGKKKLLFVCVENSNRSQMSQAFALILGGDSVEAYSAGSNPSGIVNPKAIVAMGELGYDLSKHGSKSLKEVEQYAPFDAVITMGCGDACPWMPAKQFIDWQIPDPKNMAPAEFNKVRDYIKAQVSGLLASL